jgi:CheY-like chemotaxis protein
MNLHALIIDDDANNVMILAQLLTMEGVSYTQALNPGELDGALTDLPAVDIVFLDLNMPEIDGYTILHFLKSDARFTDVPVVAYTVHFGELHTARESGFHSFLGKPLDVDLFPKQLARILNGESVWVTA